MKRFLGFASLVLFTVCMFAVPARRRPFQAMLDDGRPVTVRLTGDEFFHYYVDEEGNELERLTDGRYSRVQSPWLSAARRMGGEQRRKMAYGRRMQRAVAARKAGTFKGTKKGLVILVSYTDVKIQEKHTREVFDAMFNEEGYSENGHIGSVRDYFKAQSYGTFEIDFDVVGPYTLEHEMKYYGENDRQGNDLRVGAMIAEAVRLADADVNYKDYDWDGDGEVDQVFVVYAGYSAAAGGSSNSIWPVEWWLSSSDYGRTIRLDGVRIDQFACSSELLGGSDSTALAGIGTACHEFSHCLGLPDFYDTTPDGGNFGLDCWSVMDYGCYNGTYDDEGYSNGNIPCGYTAYERMACGWLQPTVLSEGTTVSGMKALTDAPEAYIIYNDACRDEYYLLENRQQKSWNKADSGHGMLILHVDYDEQAWLDNVVNNVSTHQRCTIIPADNSFFGRYGFATAAELAGDPWPGTSGNTSLTDTSKPAATLYNKAADGRLLMGKPIEDIKEADGLISFFFMGGNAGTLRTPMAEAATDLTGHSFVAHWTEVAGAETYTLAVTPGDADPLLFEGIAATAIEITDLDSTIVYSYRVQAVSGERKSAWSNVITVRLPGADGWTEWVPYGDGSAVYSYSKSCLLGDYGDKTYSIFARTSMSDRNLRQFRLYGWGMNEVLDVTYDASTGHCSVAQQYTGYNDIYYGCGHVYVADEVFYQNEVLGRQTTWNAYPSTFDEGAGRFTLYLAYYDLTDLTSNWGEGVETIQVSGAEFKDYSVTLTLGTLVEAGYSTGRQHITLSCGGTVEYYRYAIFPGNLTEAENLSDYVNAIADGTTEYKTGVGTTDSWFDVASGIYTIFAVSFDADGYARQYACVSFRFSSSSEWTVLGKAQYTDDVLGTMFQGLGMETYEVEVQEHLKTPGLFRMKNPYLNHPDSSPEEALEGDFYVEIDATDPSKVFIEYQALGVNWGYGDCYIYSDYESGHYGVFQNSVITFPNSGDVCVVMGDNAYGSNRNGGFRLDLSTCGIAQPQAEIGNSKESKYNLFDLQGRPVVGPQSAGLYIQNGRKVVIK